MLGTAYPIERKTEDPFADARQWKELDGFAKAAVDSGKVTVKESITTFNVQLVLVWQVGWLNVMVTTQLNLV